MGAAPPWTSGEQGAPLTIEVFNDYQCPFCGTTNEELKKIEAKYPTQVCFVFRNYPITRFHKNAVAAATAAESAGLQGKFREMIEILYARRDQWANDKDPASTFVSYALGLGLDTQRFADDMASESVSERISLDVKRAKFLKVEGTPTLFLNGAKLGHADNSKLVLLVNAFFNKHK